MNKKYREKAVRHISKPCLHRLVELAIHSLPMYGFLLRIGEINFEKRHQSVKRQIGASNQRDIHQQAFRGLVFEDWEGRLCLALSKYPNLSDDEKFSVYQLTRCHNSRFQNAVPLNSEELDSLIRERVGPSYALPFLLRTRNLALAVTPEWCQTRNEFSGKGRIGYVIYRNDYRLDTVSGEVDSLSKVIIDAFRERTLSTTIEEVAVVLYKQILFSGQGKANLRRFAPGDVVRTVDERPNPVDERWSIIDDSDSFDCNRKRVVFLLIFRVFMVTIGTSTECWAVALRTLPVSESRSWLSKLAGKRKFEVTPNLCFFRLRRSTFKASPFYGDIEFKVPNLGSLLDVNCLAELESTARAYRLALASLEDGFPPRSG